MYIYDLPLDTSDILCRLLDNDNDWKELAGAHMKYSEFHIQELEQKAIRYKRSPTKQLLISWGQMNHTTEELFILLYHMKHVPALRCLMPVVDTTKHRLDHLLSKLERKNGLRSGKTTTIDENGNRQKAKKLENSDGQLPLPILMLENGIQLQDSNPIVLKSINDDSSSYVSTSSASGDTGILSNKVIKKVTTIPMVPYEDLKEATNNWDIRNLLGKGGFGNVYKGEWKHLLVAVKKLVGREINHRALMGEMSLAQYPHDNILPLYGYSIGGEDVCLIYQYMPGGSLDFRLRSSAVAPLTWCQRYRVAHGVAKGLLFLHTMADKPLIHGDIKPHNILLDKCLMPKIGDFGLARKGAYVDEKTHLKVKSINGTQAYLPDDYLRSRELCPSVDVFSYGVVLVEMALLMPAKSKSRPAEMLGVYVHMLAKSGTDFGLLEDPRIRNSPESNPDLCRKFVQIGLDCTKSYRKERPSMLDVYKRLDALDVPGKDW